MKRWTQKLGENKFLIQDIKAFKINKKNFRFKPETFLSPQYFKTQAPSFHAFKVFCFSKRETRANIKIYCATREKRYKRDLPLMTLRVISNGGEFEGEQE